MVWMVSWIECGVRMLVKFDWILLLIVIIRWKVKNLVGRETFGVVSGKVRFIILFWIVERDECWSCCGFKYWY